MKINFGKIRTFMTWLTNLLIKGRELGYWAIGHSTSSSASKSKPLGLK